MRLRTQVSFAAVLLLVVVACTRPAVSTHYTPDKAKYRSGVAPVALLATVAYQGDIPALVEAHGEIIGDLAADGNRKAGQRDVESTVRRRAAALGATHVVFIAAHTQTHQGPSTYRTKCASERCITQESLGDISKTPHARYILIPVPRTNWARLPSSLWVTVQSTKRSPARAPQRSGLAITLGFPEEVMPEPREASSPEDVETRKANVQRSTEIRQRCFEQAQNELSGMKLAANAPELTESTERSPQLAAAGFGEAYASMKAQDVARRQKASEATPKERALQWYRACVARESEVLAGQAR